MSDITYGEVFAGIGSAVAAWKPLGWECKYYVENNNAALAQYLYNWNDRFKSYIDSRKPKPSTQQVLTLAENWVDPLRRGNVYRVSRLPNVDVMLTSPPCTSFTKGGNQTGLDAQTGDLFFEAHRLIQKNLPRTFIFENVPYMMDLEEELVYDRLVEKDRVVPRRTFNDIILPSLGNGKITIQGRLPFEHDYPDVIKVWRKGKGKIWPLKRLPYDLFVTTLDPLDFGIPMRRKRVFIVGFRKGVYSSEDFTFPHPKNVVKKSIFDYVEPQRKNSDSFRFKTFDPGTYAYNEASKASYVIETGGKEYPASTFMKHPLRPRRLVIKTKDGIYRSFADEQRRRLMGFPPGFDSTVVSKTNAFKNLGNAISVDILRMIGEQMAPIIEKSIEKEREW